ncbi:hypothetical protein KQI84_07615 [bacterium]|nr:hypothetical protein [bacterium]
MINPELLEILVCPETKAPLVVDQDGNLVSTDASSRRKYRVDEGIPILLIDESEVITPEEHGKAMKWAEEHPIGKQPRKADQ